MSTDPRRDIPAVDRLLGSAAFAPLLARAPRPLIARLIRDVQQRVRADLASGDVSPEVTTEAWHARQVGEALGGLQRPTLRRVINATGIILHTNLGRAPLAPAARAAVVEAANGYCNLEFDLAAGIRGSRHAHCAELLRQLTGAGAALVVNNNAAALVLALDTLARGRDAIISRGELVEIGDSFRVAEIMARSGARMVEVGASNRTHLSDYRAALSPDTGALLKVHRSNFLITGFTAEVAVAELAHVAGEAAVPLLYDLGSGLLLPAASLGLPPEPTASEALGMGADLITLSGDKLLGGPQAGILLGTPELIDRCRKNPLSRALRVDKLTLAALGATLELYLDPARARAEIPVLRMLLASQAEVATRASRIAAALRRRGVDADVADGESAAGGGASPGHVLASAHVVIRTGGSCRAAEGRLRAGDPAVLVRVQEDRLRIDPRTVDDSEEDALIEALGTAALA